MLLLFILLHELTHMIVGIILGLKLKKITIMPFGFKVEFKKYNCDGKNEIKNMIISLSGPTSNCLLIIIAILFKWNINIIYSNLLIIVFNLLPIYPLDGGRVLKSFLKLKFKKSKAYYLLNKISNISMILLTMLSSILILYIKNIFILFVILYLWYIVFKENKRYNIIKRAYEAIDNNKFHIIN